MIFWNGHWEKVFGWERLYLHHRYTLSLSFHGDDLTMARKDEHVSKMWAILRKTVGFEDPTPLLDQVHLGCTQRGAQSRRKNRMGVTKAITDIQVDGGKRGNVTAWSHEKQGHAQKSVERFCDYHLAKTNYSFDALQAYCFRIT